jgi:hypothetical protein
MVLEIKPTAEDIEPEVSRPGLFIHTREDAEADNEHFDGKTTE